VASNGSWRNLSSSDDSLRPTFLTEAESARANSRLTISAQRQSPQAFTRRRECCMTGGKWSVVELAAGFVPAHRRVVTVSPEIHVAAPQNVLRKLLQRHADVIPPTSSDEVDCLGGSEGAVCAH
jgi:hypothetical protein